MCDELLEQFCSVDIDINDLRDICCKVSRTFYKVSYDIPLSDFDLPYNLCVQIRDFYCLYNNYGILWKRAMQDSENRKKQRQRLKKRISRIMESNNPLFLTLTFRDSVLNSTNDVTRNRYVKDFLRSISFDYVANIDFGTNNGREHYHCIVALDKDISFNLWKYGAINFKRIINTESSTDRLKMYLSKLINHSIKNSSNLGKKLIFSKGSKNS